MRWQQVSAFRREEKAGGRVGRESTTSRGESFFWLRFPPLQFFLIYVYNPTHMYIYIGRDQDPTATEMISDNLWRGDLL